MLKNISLYIFYLIIFISLLAMRSTFSEILSCYIVPDPIILIVFLLFDINIKTYFKYLIIIVLAFFNTQFSIGIFLISFLSYVLLYYVYQRIMKTLNREDKLSVIVSLSTSLLIYEIYTNFVSFMINHSFLCDFYICTCNFFINIFFSFLLLNFLGLKLRKQNG